jgi:hypothetical protein
LRPQLHPQAISYSSFLLFFYKISNSIIKYKAILTTNATEVNIIKKILHFARFFFGFSGSTQPSSSFFTLIFFPPCSFFKITPKLELKLKELRLQIKQPTRFLHYGKVLALHARILDKSSSGDLSIAGNKDTTLVPYTPEAKP